MHTRRFAVVLLVAAACHPSAGSVAQPTSETETEPAATVPTLAPTTGQDAGFTATATTILDAQLAANPGRGVELGLHQYDGKMPDVSNAGLAADLKRLHAALATLNALDTQRLSSRQRVERHTLLATLYDDQLELEVTRAPWRNPMFYLGALDLTPYISRNYAAKAHRARAVMAIANATPAYLTSAASNLEAALPKTFVQTALLQTRGTAVFVRSDVPAALHGLPPKLGEDLGRALNKMAVALDGFAAALEAKLPQANDGFALGQEHFANLLTLTQGVDTDLATLEAVFKADLERNLAAMDVAATAIDPTKSTRDVVALVVAQKPAPDQVLATAARQATAMRKLLVDKKLVSIPSQDLAQVVESPPFMRWNAAFLSGAGPFESVPLPSFYYISPPDPSWSAAKQRDYVPGTHDLLFITVHEVWPGHFLHSLHLKHNPSPILKSLWNYTTGEGWAHYTEEMMWQEGMRDDQRARVGQLMNALLRNVRALCAVGLHTQGWTVPQCKQMFLASAFQDEANAEQQAVRGTFDPMYLAYTTGKLAILKLRRDVRSAKQAKGETFSLLAFHDELLSYGAAPVSAIRTAMLGPTAGALL